MKRSRNWIRKLFEKDRILIESENFENLDEEGKGMIRGIVELSETPVKEVMIPRIDTTFIREDSEMEKLVPQIVESGHSRFPVYKETIDKVIGILYVKDLLPVLINAENISISKILRPAYFVPESMKIDNLLREMKQRRIHLAIAVDEYGGVSGIISMEDILEEIVGDIQDEFDNEGEEIIPSGENKWLCDARINIEDLNEALNLNIPADDFDTLGGFVFDLFGKIPARYEKTEWNGYDFIIQRLEGHTIRQVMIAKETPTEEE